MTEAIIKPDLPEKVLFSELSQLIEQSRRYIEQYTHHAFLANRQANQREYSAKQASRLWQTNCVASGYTIELVAFSYYHST